MPSSHNFNKILPKEFTVKNHELYIGSKSITQLMSDLGSLPCYIYHKNSILEQIAKLRTYLPKSIALHYAIKANPMPQLIQYLAHQVDGFDVASEHELKMALNTTMSRQDMSFAGPGKSLAELRLAIKNEVLINCESKIELQRIEKIAKSEKLNARVSIRVNPDYSLKASGMKMGGGAQQFGIDAEQVPQLLKNWPQSHVNFEGFHIFSGSQNLNAKSIIECQNQTFELAANLSEYAPNAPKMINIGGGFGIPYFPKDAPLELEPIGENLKLQLEKFKKRLPQAKFIIELGRYMVGPSGIYICEIVDIKISRGQLFYIVNGGLNHHLSASGNFGQIIRKNYPVAVLSKMHVPENTIATVVGPLCTPLDLLGDRMPLAKAEIGDLIGIFQSGAYGFSASPQGFLSHPSAKEVLI